MPLGGWLTTSRPAVGGHRFTELLLATVETFKVGLALDQDTVTGPVSAARRTLRRTKESGFGR
jgi:hypothetical protein